MKFLLNMNVPRELGRRLAGIGHLCRHVGDIGMAQASDVDVVQEARRGGEIIITHDLDYGHLLAFSGESSPSVIIVRLRNIRPDHVARRLVDSWSVVNGPLSEGAIVVLEDAALRIRKLPITLD